MYCNYYSEYCCIPLPVLFSNYPVFITLLNIYYTGCFLECRVFKMFYFRKFLSDFDVLGRFGNLKGGAKIFLFGNLIILIRLKMTVTILRHIIQR